MLKLIFGKVGNIGSYDGVLLTTTGGRASMFFEGLYVTVTGSMQELTDLESYLNRRKDLVTILQGDRNIVSSNISNSTDGGFELNIRLHSLVEFLKVVAHLEPSVDILKKNFKLGSYCVNEETMLHMFYSTYRLDVNDYKHVSNYAFSSLIAQLVPLVKLYLGTDACVRVNTASLDSRAIAHPVLLEPNLRVLDHMPEHVYLQFLGA